MDTFYVAFWPTVRLAYNLATKRPIGIKIVNNFFILSPTFPLNYRMFQYE